MKISVAVAVLSGVMLLGAAAPAFANADDAKWIKQCVADNKDEGQSAETIAVYCSCMDNKMSNNETRSITQWEKSHPAAQEACSKQAHWKD
ncbi:MAG TPA: hypothetical protein VHD15_16165 [Hyphomicrobiales bacterium]|nr:hypothetical protein [Hyphomicrobiales bacterium]